MSRRRGRKDGQWPTLNDNIDRVAILVVRLRCVNIDSQIDLGKMHMTELLHMGILPFLTITILSPILGPQSSSSQQHHHLASLPHQHNHNAPPPHPASP